MISPPTLVKADETGCSSIDDDPNDALLVTLAFRKLDLASHLRSVDDDRKAKAYLTGADPYSNRGDHPGPRFVLLDLKLNGSSGLDLLVWARSQLSLRHLPIIVLSSSSRREDIFLAYELGANSYVSKPSSLEGIQEMVQTAYRYWKGLNLQTAF